MFLEAIFAEVFLIFRLVLEAGFDDGGFYIFYGIYALSPISVLLMGGGFVILDFF